MSGIIATFGTPTPVTFKEKGCDTAFTVRINGALYLDAYDEPAYGATMDERRSNLGIFAVKKIEEHLAHWHEGGKILCVEGEDELERMLFDDLKAAGMTGSANIKKINITDESNDAYRELIMTPYQKAMEAKRQEELAAAEEPHGPLRHFSYNLSSHGMMAGTSSSYSRTVDWNRDGTIIFRSYSSGSGKSTELEYKLTPETASKISGFAADKHLAALSKMDIPTATMFDNFTSSTICMTFDDSSIGGDPNNDFTLQCGPAGLTFKTIEDELRQLLDECESAGECIKNEERETQNGFGAFFGMGGMPMTCSNPGTMPGNFNGMTMAEEAIRQAKAIGASMNGAGSGETSGSVGETSTSVESTSASAGETSPSPSNAKWTCACGSVNTGKFCPECGQPKPSGWVCSCGAVNAGKFCANCGQPRA